MRCATLENHAGPLEDPDAVYKTELDAAHKTLHAERSDLAQLLCYIHGNRVSPRQVPVLLGQAYARLRELRENRTHLSSRAGKEPGIATPVEQADRALQAGGGFSLDDADQAYEKACRRCLELEDDPESAARIRARQASIAAVKQRYRHAAGLYGEAAEIPGLDVPLQWHFQIRRALVLEDLGREFMDNAALEQAIDLYESTIIDLAPRNERPEDWATTQDHFGNALGILGQRHQGTQMLERSIMAFRNALSERSRERKPLDWATTQNNLGNALGTLALRHGDTAMLEASVAAFESALEERTRERTPAGWATTQNNLAAAFQSLGQRKNDTQLLKKSVEAYKNVLREWTRDGAPLDWASTLNNLGTVLRMLGERRKGPRTLEQSVAAYNSALAVRTRERVPQDWAMTQNNLGAALQKLGERREDPRILELAIAAYDNALKECTRERMPMAWAMTMANLGVARKTLAELTKDVEIARQAVTAFEAVSGVFRSASHAHYYELSEEQRARTLKVLAELGGDDS
jgi:tetratricopeptide (TPR) repeat protein